MLFALLYNGHDEMIAATLAASQQAVGDNYWRDVYPQRVQVSKACQTAYVDIEDADLIEKMNSLETDDKHLLECRHRIDELTGVLPRMKRVYPKAA